MPRGRGGRAIVTQGLHAEGSRRSSGMLRCNTHRRIGGALHKSWRGSGKGEGQSGQPLAVGTGHLDGLWSLCAPLSGMPHGALRHARVAPGKHRGRRARRPRHPRRSGMHRPDKAKERPQCVQRTDVANWLFLNQGKRLDRKTSRGYIMKRGCRFFCRNFRFDFLPCGAIGRPGHHLCRIALCCETTRAPTPMQFSHAIHTQPQSRRRGILRGRDWATRVYAYTRVYGQPSAFGISQQRRGRMTNGVMERR